MKRRLCSEVMPHSFQAFSHWAWALESLHTWMAEKPKLSKYQLDLSVISELMWCSLIFLLTLCVPLILFTCSFDCSHVPNDPFLNHSDFILIFISNSNFKTNLTKLFKKLSMYSLSQETLVNLKTQDFHSFYKTLLPSWHDPTVPICLHYTRFLSRNAMTVIYKRQHRLALVHTVSAALALRQSAGRWHCCSSSRVCGWFLSVDNVAIFVSCPVILLHFLCLSWRPNVCRQIRRGPNYFCCVMFRLNTARNVHITEYCICSCIQILKKKIQLSSYYKWCETTNC